MNKHFRKVLTVLKTKAKDLGFSRDELKSVAAKIADNLDLNDDSSDEDISSAIDDAVDTAMDFLTVSQSAAQRVISNYRKKHNVPQDQDDDDADGGEPQAPADGKGEGTPPKKSKEEEPPEWAKSILDSVSKLTERVSSVERTATSKGRRAQIEEALRDTGRYGERRLKEFDRVKDTFKSDEEFSEYLDEVRDDLEAYNQERADEGLAKLGIPGVAATGKTVAVPSAEEEEAKPLSADEIDLLAKEF